MTHLEDYNKCESDTKQLPVEYRVIPVWSAEISVPGGSELVFVIAVFTGLNRTALLYGIVWCLCNDQFLVILCDIRKHSTEFSFNTYVNTNNTCV